MDYPINPGHHERPNGFGDMAITNEAPSDAVFNVASREPVEPEDVRF